MKSKNKILFASVLLLFSLITVINVQAQANATNTPPAITGINVEKIISINPDGSSSASLIEAAQNGGTVAVEKDARIDLFIKFKDYDGVGNFTEATLYSPAGNLVCLAKDAVYNPNADAYSCNESTLGSLRGFLVSKEGFGTYSGNVCDAVNSCTPVRITLTEKASGGTGGGGGVIVQPPSGGGSGGGTSDSCTKYYTCPDGTLVKECELVQGTTTNTATGGGGGGGCRCASNPASLCPTAKDFHLGVTADKYSYSKGEQAKITAILSSPYAGMNFESAAVTAHVSTSFARTSACPLNTACGGSVASYPIDMKPVGWIAEACAVSSDGTTTCPVVQKYQYMFVGYFDILNGYASGGYTISSAASLNGVTQQSSSTFEVRSGETPVEGGVAISLEPTEQKTVVGEPATYIIRLTDKHPARACAPCALKDAECINKCSQQYYTYSIEIFGLPYSSTYDTSVSIPAGGTGETKLIVYPSSTAIQTVAKNVTLEQPATGVVVSPTTTTAVAQKAVAVQQGGVKSLKSSKATATIVATTQTSAEAAKEMVVSGKAERATATVQPTTTEPARVVSGAGATQVETTKESIIRFTVKATQADNQNVADKATGVLIVRYIETPQPPITPPTLPGGEIVTINILKGWNLINLPGDYTSTKSSCKSDLVAFIYLADQKRYVKVEEAQKILGDKFSTYVAQHSFWAYSKENCEGILAVKNFATYSGLELTDGWNFLGTTKDMVGETLSSIKGSCEISKAYTFNTENNKWSALAENALITVPYYGMIVKASNACTLGTSTIMVPPPLPEE